MKFHQNYSAMALVILISLQYEPISVSFNLIGLFLKALGHFNVFQLKFNLTRSYYLRT